jgi:hypothetical protein
MPEGLELGFEAGNADRRGPHVNAAARLPEIERNAEHTNFFADYIWIENGLR